MPVFKNNTENKKDKPKKEYRYICIHKDYIKAVNLESVLIQTPKHAELDDLSALFWIKKAYVYTNEYSNIVRVSLCVSEGFKYSLFNAAREKIDWKTPDTTVEGRELADLLTVIFKQYN